MKCFSLLEFVRFIFKLLVSASNANGLFKREEMTEVSFCVMMAAGSKKHRNQRAEAEKPTAQRSATPGEEAAAS